MIVLAHEAINPLLPTGQPMIQEPMSNQPATAPPSSVLRPAASVVMKLDRLGAFHQSRLSFMRVLLRRLKGRELAIQTELNGRLINASGVGRRL